jgi:hypothetical protein
VGPVRHQVDQPAPERDGEAGGRGGRRARGDLRRDDLSPRARRPTCSASWTASCARTRLHRGAPGITREIALELARALDLPVREEPLAVDELPGADELFLTSTTNDVMPVVAVDGRSVGDGTPGPLTRQLAAAFAARAARPVVAVG